MTEVANPNANSVRRLKRRMALEALAIVGLALLCGWFVGTLIGDSDPLLRGKPESEWIKNLKYVTDDGYDEQLKEWRGYGQEGVQVLIRGLRRANHPGERAYRQLWRRLPYTIARKLPSPKQDETAGTRHRIVALLSSLSDEAKSAVPILIYTVNEDESDNVRNSAIGFFNSREDERCLLNQLPAEQKGKLLPGLLRAARDTSKWVTRNQALIALKWYSEEKQTVAPLLLAGLKDTNITIRLSASAALHRIDPDAAKLAGVTPMVIGLAKNQTNAATADYAIRILGKFHHDPEAAISALIECLDNNDSRLATAAVVSLEDDGFLKYSDTILPALTNVARRKGVVGWYATNAIQNFQWDLERQAAK